MSAFPCEVIVSYFRVIFFLAPVECCVPRVSWTFPLYWFSLKSSREFPIYLLEQCHSSFTFAITEDQRLDNLEGEVVRLSHSSRGIAISSEVLILHPCQWWKAVDACDSRGQDRGHSLLGSNWTLWGLINFWENKLLFLILLRAHYSLLNPYVPTPLHYQSTLAWVVIVPMEHVIGSVTSCHMSMAKFWLAKPPGVYNTKKAVFATHHSRQTHWFKV